MAGFKESALSAGNTSWRSRASPDAFEHLHPGLHGKGAAFVLSFMFYTAKAEAEPASPLLVAL